MIFLSPSAMKGGGYIPWLAGSAHALRRHMIFLGPSTMKGGGYMHWEAGSAHAFGRHMIFLGPSAMKGGGYIHWEGLSAHVGKDRGKPPGVQGPTRTRTPGRVPQGWPRKMLRRVSMIHVKSAQLPSSTVTCTKWQSMGARTQDARNRGESR